MNMKKYHFNSIFFKKNDDYLNSQTITNTPLKNTKYYDKNFYQVSVTNQSLNFNQNNFLSSEQSTLLTSEDYQNKKYSIAEQLRKRNNCHCLCHQIEETVKNSYNNIHIIKCHNHCLHHINNYSYYRPMHKSIEIGQNRHYRKTKNFELVYNYEKLKKQYNIIWPGYNHNRNARPYSNNYISKNKGSNKFSYPKNIDILDSKYSYRHLNRSCDDINNYNNYNHNFILRKTRKILGIKVK